MASVLGADVHSFKTVLFVTCLSWRVKQAAPSIPAVLPTSGELGLTLDPAPGLLVEGHADLEINNSGGKQVASSKATPTGAASLVVC